MSVWGTRAAQRLQREQMPTAKIERARHVVVSSAGKCEYQSVIIGWPSTGGALEAAASTLQRKITLARSTDGFEREAQERRNEPYSVGSAREFRKSRTRKAP